MPLDPATQLRNTEPIRRVVGPCLSLLLIAGCSGLNAQHSSVFDQCQLGRGSGWSVTIISDAEASKLLSLSVDGRSLRDALSDGHSERAFAWFRRSPDALLVCAVPTRRGDCAGDMKRAEVLHTRDGWQAQPVLSSVCTGDPRVKTDASLP